MTDGFIKVAAGTPKIRVADCAHNGAQVAQLMGQAAQQGVKVLALPELCLTGYTCADLFLQDALLDGAEQALVRVMEETAGLDLLAALGLPVRANNKLYNCAAILHRGKLLGLVPKSHIPNYGEFYEARWFAAAGTLEGEVTLSFAGQEGVLLSPDQLFRCAALPNLTVGVEICEDLWVPTPPSARLCAAGATLVLNLSASDEVAGKAAYRRDLVAGQSGRLVCGYVYADAGAGESSTDLVFSGHNMVAENGTLLVESRFDEGLTVSELDIDRLCYERRRLSTFPPKGPGLRVQEFSLTVEDTELTRPVSPAPFVPQGELDRAERCDEILRLAALGLKQRLEHTRARCALIGLSGGLDSTLAILIAAMAFDLLGRAREEIIAVTMPCFGTTVRTRSNAEQLAQQLGARLLTVDIGDAVSQHFADIGQSMRDHSITYENSQARERTQVLMDLANQREGLVVGTGDLSELALGWCTYNGDHMSMYAVNASIPKTLVRHLVAFVADEQGGELGRVLWDILDTPVSPELLPPQDGEIAQRTEELVGPYELHDFFLYYMVRFGYSPRKIYRVALRTFGGDYDAATIKTWLCTFIRRFFAQQFKRSCLPDGPKVGSVALSPRGDWRMPSDASAELWLHEAEEL